MVSKLAIAVALASALAFSVPAFASDHYDDLGDGWGQVRHERSYKKRHRHSFSDHWYPVRREAAPSQPRQVYHWPDSRYYGPSGMMLD
jgi:hypothetical protein